MTPYLLILENIFTQNLIVFGFLFFVIFLTFRAKTDKKWLIPMTTSIELKWLAILSIIFIHIGYELAKNQEFLHPISSFAWVGVDTFLLLSGYGLTISALKNPLSIKDFYKKRLLKVIFPFWVAISLIFIADFLIHGTLYSTENILKSFLVYFPTADIWTDFNSPLWYSSWLLFFYLTFPFIFRANFPVLSAIFLYSLALNFVKINPIDMNVNYLHSVHLVAFPLGIILASYSEKIKKFLENIFSKKYFHFVFFVILIGIFVIFWNIKYSHFENFSSFLARFWNPEKIVEQFRSILLTLTSILIFISLPFKNNFLAILGLFSYEIYLLHWPLIARYDVFFHHFDAGIAMILWIFMLIFIAFCFQKLVYFLEKFFKKIFHKSI